MRSISEVPDDPDEWEDGWPWEAGSDYETVNGDELVVGVGNEIKECLTQIEEIKYRVLLRWYIITHVLSEAKQFQQSEWQEEHFYLAV